MAEIASAKLSIEPSALPRDGAFVLDVGCGDGRHTRAAAARACRVIGVDYDVSEVKLARERSPSASFVAADAGHLPFRDGVFDAVICTETLEHLRDDRGSMREIARVLSPHGLLHGAVPSHFTELVYFRISEGYRNAPGGHVRIYAPHVLIARLYSCGLQVTSFRYVHFVDSLIWLRYCLTDAVRRKRPRTDFEAAVLLAVAQERPVAGWRRRLRQAIAESRVIAAIDRIGALVWPKSLTFTARRRR